MRKLFDEELDEIKELVLKGESPSTDLGNILTKHEYLILQLYIKEEYSDILNIMMNFCEAELHRMTAEAILWRE